MTRALSLLLVLSLSAQKGHATVYDLDSLFAIWTDTTVDIEKRISTMQRYAWHGFLYDDPDSAFALAERSFYMAEEAGLVRLMGWARLGQGVTFEMRGDNPRALKYYLLALEYFNACDDKAGIAGALNNIGMMYNELGEYEMAEEYHLKSLELRYEVNDIKGKAGSYENLGNIKKAQGEYEEAIKLYRTSLQLKKEAQFPSGMITSLADIGLAHGLLGNVDSAEIYLNRSLDLARSMDAKLSLATHTIELGELYLSLGRLEEAEKACLEAWQIAVEITNRDQQFKACDCLYRIYKQEGRNADALDFLEYAERLKDSLQEQVLMIDLKAMEFGNQLLMDSIAQSEKDLKNQIAFNAEVRKKTRNRNVLFVVLGSTILLVLGFSSRISYIRRSNKRLAKEKERSESLLLNILPEEVAEELKIKGRSEARDFPNVTVLFTDFEEFTTRAMKMSAQELVSEINICFQAFDKIIDRYEVEKIKTIGDSYMAAGGLHDPGEYDPTNTILAGLEMQEFVMRRKAEMSKRGKIYFEMRAGIHTGPVVAGIVGVKKFQYDIWGDTVNTASRMESHGSVGRLNISNDTYEQVKNDPQFVFEQRGTTEVKGKGMMNMWFVRLAQENKSVDET
jgi:class 3 adenylate cyclase